MEKILGICWAASLMASCVLIVIWRPRSTWNNRVSDESQRLSLAFVAVVLPPIAIAFMWWDLCHQERHRQIDMRH